MLHSRPPHGVAKNLNFVDDEGVSFVKRIWRVKNTSPHEAIETFRRRDEDASAITRSGF